jgi:hypothetical protein
MDNEKIVDKAESKSENKRYKDIYEEIFERMRSFQKDCYINIFAGDDQKKQKKVYNTYYNLNNSNYKDILSDIDIHNTGSYGVFMNFNLLNTNRRIHDNIKKILYIFIDLDDADKDDNDLIKTNLNSKNISYSYNAKSGRGYHFLIPVCFESTEKCVVKGFLEYLRNNVSNKVDVATHTNERLIRCPESLHNKDKEAIQLQTLEYKTLSQDIINNNSDNVKDFQEDSSKRAGNIDYIKSITRHDIFFKHILTDTNNWRKYIDYLNKSKQRNNIFVKNLGIFLYHYPEYIPSAEDFLSRFESSRIKALQGWSKKAKEDDMKVNYYELLKWAKEYKIEEFVKELKNNQLKNLFLDRYEFYYIENERSDNNIILYYPEENYYLQKSMQEVLVNIYYNCKEKGLDLVEELSLRDIYEKWDTFNFKQQYTKTLDQLRRVIEEENRIRLVYNINYEPTENKFIYKDSKKFFNIYKKSNLLNYYKKQDKYHYPFIRELLLNLVGEDEESYLWFCKWLAWIVRNPTEKLPTAVILQGKQGSGKGTLKKLILNNIFGPNCQEINQTDLETPFNDYLLGKQIIVANEVMHNENRQTLPNVLKNLVTDDEITIKIKFKNSIVGNNYTHWIFSTNNDNPIKIDEDDRRYSVFYSEKMRKGLCHDIRRNLDYELKEFMSFLKDLELDFDEVSNPIHTTAKDDIINLNKDSIATFVEYMSQFNSLYETYISLYDIDLHDSFFQNNIFIYDEETNQKYILTDTMYNIYKRYCERYGEKGVFKKQNFSKKLSSYQVKSVVKWIQSKPKKIFEVDKIEENLINVKHIEEKNKNDKRQKNRE